MSLYARFYLLGVRMGSEAEHAADVRTAHRAEEASRGGTDGRPFGENEAESDLRVNGRRKVATSCIALAKRWRWTPGSVRTFVEGLPHELCVVDDGQPDLFASAQ